MILERYVVVVEVGPVREVRREVVHGVVREVVREVEADQEVHERPQNPLVISNLG